MFPWPKPSAYGSPTSALRSSALFCQTSPRGNSEVSDLAYKAAHIATGTPWGVPAQNSRKVGADQRRYLI